MDVSLDKWNVWYQKRFVWEEQLDITPAPPLIEDTYSVVDAVVVGNLLISMLRHADRVRIGCLAQLVNVIAPIRTEAGGPSWRQTIFHPFALTSRHGRGAALRTQTHSPVMDTAWFGDAPVVDATAVLDENSGAITLFAVNRDQSEPTALTVDLRSVPDLVHAEHTGLFDQDPDAVNSAAEPERVVPRRLNDIKIVDGRLEVNLPALSWNMVRLLPEG
jgi:alpha-N-arabinofuranosidase